MFEGSRRSSCTAGTVRLAWTPVVLGLVLLTAGCGTVAVSLEQPAGARVELYRKGKWFGCFGPDWCTGWNRVALKAVEEDTPAEFELEAENNWLEHKLTAFPRRYRACFDLSQMHTYPNTPTRVVEVKWVRNVIPPKHQEIVKLWHEGRTLDALVRLPLDVLADVLYNLGSKFKRLLHEEVPAEAQVRAAKEFKAMLEAPEDPSPQAVESWLKSLLTKEQLDQVCRWVRNGVTLTDVKWVRLGGEPKHKGMPVLWRLFKSFVELFIRQPEIRSTSVDFYHDVILRGLLVRKVETRLVNLDKLRFYAELRTFRTSYYSDRVVPAIDLVQNIGITEIVKPTADQEAELNRVGMTRSVRFDATARAEALRRGLPPVGLGPMKVTSIHSQVIGALLENELAYVVIWNNPNRKDPVRFLTTVVTTGPYGMARVSARRGDQGLYEATTVFSKYDAPLGLVLQRIIACLKCPLTLLFQFDEPLAVIAFGGRRIAPWSEMPRPPVSRVKMTSELEPAEGAAGK